MEYVHTHTHTHLERLSRTPGCHWVWAVWLWHPVHRMCSESHCWRTLEWHLSGRLLLQSQAWHHHLGTPQSQCLAHLPRNENSDPSVQCDYLSNMAVIASHNISAGWLITSPTGLDEEQFRLPLQRWAVLAIEVVGNDLDWNWGPIYPMHCTRETVVTYLQHGWECPSISV